MSRRAASPGKKRNDAEKRDSLSRFTYDRIWRPDCATKQPLMEIPHEATLLRIFIGESDRYEHRPLYEAIILKAREMHLAGATALRGPVGFGKSSRMHTSKILRLSMDLPMIIEIVDSEEKIQSFLPILDGMITGGLVTMEKIRALHYRGAVSGDAR